MPRFTPLRLLNDNKAVAGVNMGHLWHKMPMVRGWGEQLMAWHADGKLHPHVDRVFPFAEAPAAHQYLHERKAIGKVLLVP
jgi:synaptic vesicle membrane protein VAT-1